MAVNVITSANSQTSQLADLDAGAFLLVAEDGYLVDTRNGIPAYYANGGSANVTIKGTVITGGGFGGLYLGQNESSSVGGSNSVTIASTGVVQGNNAISAFGGANVIVNDGLLRGTGTSDPSTLSNNEPAGVYMFGDANRLVNNGTITGFYGLYVQGSNTIITNTGLLATTGVEAIRLLGTGTLYNSGRIEGQVYARTNTMAIENTGVIAGDVALNSGGSVLNYGTITGSCRGINGNMVVDNHGTIGDIFAGQGGNTVFNRLGGTIGVTSFESFGTATIGDTFTNDGQVGSVDFDAGQDSFTNTGRITGRVDMGGGGDGLANTGVIAGAVSLGAGEDNLTNHGTILSVSAGDGADKIYNSAGGTILQSVLMGGSDAAADVLVNDGAIGIDLSIFNAATVSFGSGSDTFYNTGMVNAVVDMGDTVDVDTLVNSGHITGGAIMGAGNDIVDTSNGTIDGKVDLGAGNDSYTGSAAGDRVIGGTNVDTIDLGGGDDFYFAGNNDGRDTVDAGAGVDTYTAAACTVGVTIDLSAGTTSGTIGNDQIDGFERAIGGRGNDVLIGSDDANRLDGGLGNDSLAGGDGADRLIGGVGTDTLNGGAGRDVLTGGTPTGSVESDIFLYVSTADSGVRAATRDAITYFTDHGSAAGPFANGADLIDLSRIDANTATAGDQAFSFNATQGAAFSGAAGSLVWRQFDGYALVSGDVNGDRIADFTIQLNGTHTLFASDFSL